MIVATNVATSCDKCFYSSENIYNAKYGDNHACQGGVSADAQQFDFEYQCGTAGYAWLRELAISHFGRKVDFPFVTHAHLLHGYYPSFYQVAQAESGHPSIRSLRRKAAGVPPRLLSNFLPLMVHPV